MDAKLKDVVQGPNKAISQTLTTLVEAVQALQTHADEFGEDDLYERYEEVAELVHDANHFLKEIIKEID